MVNLKRIMAGIIAGATVVSMAACSNGTTDSTSTSSDTETTIDDEIENPVSVGDISIDAPTSRANENSRKKEVVLQTATKSSTTSCFRTMLCANNAHRQKTGSNRERRNK